MKRIALFLTLWITSFTKAQIGIGRADIANESVSLQFGDNENRGLIVPYVTDKNSITENGTVIFDTTDNKVKYLKDSNQWFDLSVDTTGTANLNIQGNDKTEYVGSKVSIHNTTSSDSTQGILVLSDNNKAMILPKVTSPHLNIISPSAGMIVYDPIKKILAVYNGSVWSFWKP